MRMVSHIISLMLVTRSEKNYTVTDLEVPVMVWGVAHFCHYLYGH